MLVKYCVDNQVCLTEFFDVVFENSLLIFNPIDDDFLPLIIKDLYSYQVKSIFDDLYNYNKVDLTIYRYNTFYDDQE